MRTGVRGASLFIHIYWDKAPHSKVRRGTEQQRARDRLFKGEGKEAWAVRWSGLTPSFELTGPPLFEEISALGFIFDNVDFS